MQLKEVKGLHMDRAGVEYCNFKYEYVAIKKTRVLEVRVREPKIFKYKKRQFNCSNRSYVFYSDVFWLNSNAEKNKLKNYSSRTKIYLQLHNKKCNKLTRTHQRYAWYISNQVLDKRNAFIHSSCERIFSEVNSLIKTEFPFLLAQSSGVT